MGITDHGRFGPLQHEASVDDCLPSEVSGGVCVRFGRGGVHSLLTAIVIKKKCQHIVSPHSVPNIYKYSLYTTNNLPYIK